MPELPPPPPASPDETRKLRVLVVDHDTAGRECLLILLAFWGHEARGAADGPAALEAAKEFRPDAVLLDLDLPGMTAEGVTLRLRHDQESRAFLVALGGRGKPEEVRKAMAAGCDRHLTKPCDPAQLRALLDSRRSPREDVNP